ncbi:5'-3' exoribonuclease 3-like isoform X2 [Prosopis cineraria]|uniref:5'-3' exoribonuclease 3-like isoform X2 n=1 Tax=Prosopis cineraria TaxID=364024 RepID=UPI00240F56F4|nr:5'-3' exoribonuclease 3-like isoform X2 [Prosopis cineraria]
MGVPAFYKWLLNKYHNVAVKARQDTGGTVDTTNSNADALVFDNLYLDLNGVIHPCFHPDDDKILLTTFEDVFHNVFEYIDQLFNIVRPRKLLYMAIDGVAPRAKMNQQRSRRFRAAKDAEIRECEEDRLRRQFELEGKQVLPKRESDVSDSNLITPGTEFMHRLSRALQDFIFEKITHDPSWRNIIVILSDANVSGEGEHKVMSFIRRQRSLPDYDPNTTHCLYGLDADLIILALATHEPHFSILREDVLAREQQPKSEAIRFEFLDIGLLREYLEHDLNIQDPPKGFKIEFERIIDDFIFMCFFAGNDFLPHLPSLEIREDAVDLLITVYKKEFNKIGGYLVDMGRVDEGKAAFVKLSRVEKFILLVGTYEEKIFAKRAEIRERALRRLLRDYEQSKQEEENESYITYIDEESSPASVSLCMKPSVSTESEGQQILQNTRELKEELNKCIKLKSDLFRSGEFSNDKIKLGTKGWKERYYKVKFSVESVTDIESKRKEIVSKYTEGLLWVLKYYYSGVPSWSWFYPYNYAPFASDFRGMAQVRTGFQKGVPLKPFDQLLAVLPPRSAHALPKSFAQLMVDERSNIIDFYPLEFEVDVEGKRFAWQGVCKLPLIEEARLLTESRKLEKELTEEEAIRNSAGSDRLFVANTSKLAAKIRSAGRQNADRKIEMSTSDGIGGFITLCTESVEVNPDAREESALCAYYELPDGGNYIPRLLPGLNLPEKKICEDDIMDTPLWHERQYHNGMQRAGNANKYKTCKTYEGIRSGFQCSSRAGATYKGAGVGWSPGSGRGKQADTPSMIDTGLIRETLSLGISHSESYQSASRYGTLPFAASRNRSTCQSSNASISTYNHGFQADEKRFAWGRGRGSFASDRVNSWKYVPAKSNGSRKGFPDQS